MHHPGANSLSGDSLKHSLHLDFLNAAVLVLVHGDEGLLELRVVVDVVRWRAVGYALLEEGACLVPVERATVVPIVLGPKLIDDVVEDAILLGIRGHAVGEGVVVEEDHVVEKDLDVAGEDLPGDRILIPKRLAIDNDDVALALWLSRGGTLRCRYLSCCCALCRLEIDLRLLWVGLRHVDADLLASCVGRVALVSLDTGAASSVRHHTSDAESTLPRWIGNPGDIDEAVIDGSKRIDNHTTIGVLAIVDHHECGVDASRAVWLVIDGELIHVLNEAAAEGLHVGGEAEG